MHQYNTVRNQIAVRYTDKLDSSFPPKGSGKDAGFYEALTSAFLNPRSFDAARFSSFSTETILTYLQKTHAFYMGKCLDEIGLTIEKLSFKGDYGLYWKPVLAQMFSGYSQELIRHIEEEEVELFPYIKSLLKAKEKGFFDFCFERKLKLINHLLNHNDDAEQKLRLLVDLLEQKSDQFDDQLVLRVLIAKLRAFDLDLTIHAKMEDEVLLPQAILLEKEVMDNPDITC